MILNTSTPYIIMYKLIENKLSLILGIFIKGVYICFIKIKNMRKKASKTKSIIENILEYWNINCEKGNLDEQFIVAYGIIEENIKIDGRDGTVTLGRVTLNLLKTIREESTFIDDEDTEKKEIKGKVIDVITTLLFKRDYPISTVNDKKEEFWQECLARELLYEMIGTFCLTTRSMALERIKVQALNDLNKEIESKILAEESAIINKPEEEKTEEDKVFTIMTKAKKTKVQKTGILDKNGSDIVSEIIED